MVTNGAGNAFECCGYNPFGDQTPASHDSARRASVGGTGTATSFALQSLRHIFTIYAWDSETGLNDRGARYFGSAQGHFTSPDAYMPSADVKAPQSWNRYVYARNNPQRFIHPNGLNWSGLSEEPKWIFQNYAATYNKDNKSKLFSESGSNKLLGGLFHIYHQGFSDSIPQTRREGVIGLEAGVQSSFNRNTLRSGIAPDYRFGGAHLQPANSDARAPGNYQKFVDRWPSLRNWWN